MAAPLYDKLNTYKKDGVYPFHMPGHKRLMELGEVFSMDITEIDGFDNLHHAQDVILEAERLMAKTFGAKESYFLVNGASCGLIASILAAVKDGEEIIISRNCHKSVFDGLILSGAVPHYIMPERVGNFPVMGAVSASQVEWAVKEYPKSKAVIVTSPTYEGVVSNIKEIADIVHAGKMILIVDEAHGAHFKFDDIFPETALEMGADIVVQSLHKTLPSPTQTAVLHLGSGNTDGARLKKSLAMSQSSSPSYIFMGAMDKCREYIDREGKEAFEKYAANLLDLRQNITSLKNFCLMGSDIVGKDGILDFDMGKLVLFSDCCDLREVACCLRERYKIEVEMASPTHIIAMTSVCDSEDGFLRLKNALTEIDKTFAFEKKATRVEFVFPKPVVSATPRQAFKADSKSVSIDRAVGKICGEFVVAYPPGIPLIVPGELISEEIALNLREYKNCNITVTGMEDYMLEKIVVLE